MTIIIIGLMFIQAFLAPIQLTLTAATIDSLSMKIVGSQDSLGLGGRFSPSTWIILMALSLMAAQLIAPSLDALSAYLGDRTSVSVGDRLLEATNRWMGLSRFENPSTADDLQLVLDRSSTAGTDLLLQGGPFIPTVLTAITLYVTISGVHPLLPLAIVLTSVPKLAKSFNFAHMVSSHIAWQTPEARRLISLRDLPFESGSERDYRLFDIGSRTLARYGLVWKEVTESLNELRDRLLRGQLRSAALSDLVVGGSILIVVVQAARGSVSVGQVTLYTGAILMLSDRLRQIGLMMGYVPMILAFLPALQRILNSPPDVAQPPSPRIASGPMSQGIHFDNVTFTYPGGGAPIIHNVTFTFAPNERLALVGNNGAGKTTIVKLLLRLYEPDSGTITLDGIDIRNIEISSLRKMFGVVFQDFGRYDLTVRENIDIGDVERHHDDSEIELAARKAGASELIQRLPNGLDTRLGLRFGGRELSGGEWQKLALARLLVRDAPILVLDEPTAALDVRAEYELYEQFAEITRSRSALIISHRFSTVRMADRIVVLENGHISESGSHAELMNLHGLYYRLYSAQASLYSTETATGEMEVG